MRKSKLTSILAGIAALLCAALVPFPPGGSADGAGQLNQAMFVVVVNASASKVSSMKELIDMARAKSGQVTYSSSGSGAGRPG